LLAILLLAVDLHAAERATAPGDVEGPFVWGAAPNVSRLGNLWFAAQPDAAGLEMAKQKGIGVVVNLREPDEMSWDEAGAVQGLGMSYFSVPVSRRRPYSARAFDRIAEIVEANSGKQILIHCGNSNRAGAWLATQLVQREGLSVDEALAVARRAGLNQEPFVQRVRDYLAESGNQASETPSAASPRTHRR
jgi:protein tyrosine phosphatase (PTP) superfamily phosphohydrolase (DUF442 family)